MVVFPAVSALVSLICALLIARDALRRPKPDKTAWAIAFGLFAAAAGAEVVGSTAGWSEPLVRVYYLAGAVLVVGFLALGQLYLLAGARIARVAPGAALLVSALAASVVWAAPVDGARVSGDGWDAIERTAALSALAITVNSAGTLVIVGGLVWSAVRFRRLGVQRNRMIGCLLIAAGTLTVAMGGSLTRLGAHEYLYVAMSAGVLLIFAGYLRARRPDATRVAAPAVERPAVAGMAPGTIHRAPAADGLPDGPATGVAAFAGAPAGLASAVGRGAPADGVVSDGAARAVAFVADLLDRDDAGLSEACRVWSVPARDVDAFTRTEARRVWAMRSRLPDALLPAFDTRPPSLRLQLAELYLDVLSPDGRPPIPVPVTAAADAPSGHAANGHAPGAHAAPSAPAPVAVGAARD